jgi:uncharacterized membrane protein
LSYHDSYFYNTVFTNILNLNILIPLESLSFYDTNSKNVFSIDHLSNVYFIFKKI